MATQQPTLATDKKPIKVTISGEIATGKSCLAALITGHLKLLGHDARLVEKENGQKYIINDLSRSREFCAPRTILVEVKPAKGAS